MAHLRFGLIAAFAITVACARPATSGSTRERSDSNSISADDLAQATQVNLYDFIVAYRGRWLQSRNPSRSQGPAAIAVYIDDFRAGEVGVLRSVTISTVAGVRYYDPVEAQQRFNVHDITSIIQVITVK